ncbi:EcsC family protein [Acerihabitans sp. KWT182]|uniref:EcsC family protein n=1 Tax=Acerihabitans sp. KWT182 TaxID=3157919 RepID=A0AAU7QD68_9GAMM
MHLVYFIDFREEGEATQLALNEGNRVIPGHYEHRAVADIQYWKNLRQGASAGNLPDRNKPSEACGEEKLNAPGIANVLQPVISAIAGVCNDMAQLSVRRQAIFAAFCRDSGDKVDCLADIGALSLECVDNQVGGLAAKYACLALAEGVGVGFAGVAALALDIPALLTLNLRAIGEYATYYGFDIDRQEEKLFALQILSLVASPNDAAKNIAMAQLTRIGRDAAKKEPGGGWNSIFW